MSVLNRDRLFNLDMSHREEVLTKIVDQIEAKFGRGRASVFESRDFERNKSQIEDKIQKMKHFNEKDFPDSEKILLKDVKRVEKIVLDDISSDESDDDRRIFNKFSERKLGKRFKAFPSHSFKAGEGSSREP